MFGLHSVHLKYISILKNNFKMLKPDLVFVCNEFVIEDEFWNVVVERSDLEPTHLDVQRKRIEGHRTDERDSAKNEKCIWIDISKKKNLNPNLKKPTLKIKVILKIQFERKFMMKINGKGNFKIFKLNNIQLFNLSNTLKSLICFRMNKNEKNF